MTRKSRITIDYHRLDIGDDKAILDLLSTGWLEYRRYLPSANRAAARPRVGTVVAVN